MSQPRALTHSALRAGAEALAARDADLARTLRRHGHPPMWGRRPGFPALVRIILEQQVSLAAARTLFLRVERSLGAMEPRAVEAAGVAGLRGLGLTRQKASYCHGLAVRILGGELDLSGVARAGDEEGRRALLAVPGLGNWSVDIYYLMALRRPDVWPVGDLALAVALQRMKQLRTLPDAARQQAISGRWAPWRSVAARMLWQEYLAAPRAAR
jgi:DNA-3-methyladenine glycosylase II